MTVLTPTQTVFSGDVRSAMIPGTEGYAGFLEDHVPFVTPLKTGIVELVTEKEILYYAVAGGYFEFSTQGIVILTETAEQPQEIDLEQALEAKKIAEQNLVQAGEDGDLEVLAAEVEKAEVRVEIAQKK
ncbi:ATP synthase F1 subunit epsilon [candidate division CSSED10-310 bacterium]|uniref:ATP synthase epsilon chain n=1 Tax=candidate division CSSED10-310 bacterium TaxID=2855610 RepID=A0ABV6YU68_UNCC1